MEQKCIFNGLNWGQAVQFSSGCQSSCLSAQVRDVGWGRRGWNCQRLELESGEPGIPQGNELWKQETDGEPWSREADCHTIKHKVRWKWLRKNIPWGRAKGISTALHHPRPYTELLLWKAWGWSVEDPSTVSAKHTSSLAPNTPTAQMEGSKL